MYARVCAGLRLVVILIRYEPRAWMCVAGGVDVDVCGGGDGEGAIGKGGGLELVCMPWGVAMHIQMVVKRWF